MLHRFAALLSVCLVTAIGTAPNGLADPPADPNAAPAAAEAAPPPPPGGPGVAPIASAEPGTLTTPDGWKLSIGAKNESLEPVASLTNSPWSREYLVDGTFEGSVTGSGKTKLAGGSLEAGYQIGCGITQDDIESITTGGITPGVGIPFVSGNLLPITLGLSASEQIKIDLKPGTINIVPVGKKSFKGTKSRVSITGYRIKIDGCAGQSFIRSYATFTSSTDNTDDVVTYLGVTRAV
ncbi:MspA family porin [Mycobacterium sp. DL592]|uniref:MspA family porin n=1 Tax=Mycobacterium sp. DL592 TaxID=2675524 RepID=UPI00142258D7|nr:MspA family porin [Mycobacterium sp. DL592]